MLLAIDVGNTQTVFGLFDGARLAEHWRVATEAHRTGDELGALITDFLDLERVGGICLSSTVPQLIREYEAFSERYAAARLLVRPGRAHRNLDPLRRSARGRARPDRELGRGEGAATAQPCVVVDFGTSTNFDIISPEGEYVGGVLAPGVEISMEALFSRAARLVKVDFAEPPAVIGKTTASGLQSGLIYGFAGLVDGIVERIRASSARRRRWSRRAAWPI